MDYQVFMTVAPLTGHLMACQTEFTVLAYQDWKVLPALSGPLPKPDEQRQYRRRNLQGHLARNGTAKTTLQYQEEPQHLLHMSHTLHQYKIGRVDALLRKLDKIAMSDVM